MPDQNSRTRTAPTAITRPTFNAHPVCSAGRASRSTEEPYSTHYTAVGSWHYITRQSGRDQIGPVPDQYMSKDDLVATGRYHPIQKVAPELREGCLIWDEADATVAGKPDTEIVATHIVASLPPERSEQWEAIVKTYCLDNLVALGMVVDFAIHAKRHAADDWLIAPHVHLLAAARFYRRNGRIGERQKAWLANKAQILTTEEAWLEITGLGPTMPVTPRRVLAIAA